MKKLKEELKYGKKGITLISLVVTIIVLLILAGVTIATLTGDNGILTRTQQAKNETEQAEDIEKIRLAITEAQIWDTGYQELTTDSLGSILIKDGTKAIVFDSEDGTKHILFLDKKKEYKLDSNGNIENLNINFDAKYIAPSSQDEERNNGVIGIGTDGKPVDMDLWEYTKLDDGTYALNSEETMTAVKEENWLEAKMGYLGTFTENGKIDGMIPQYIKGETDDTFIPVTDLTYLFARSENIKVMPDIPDTVTNMNNTFLKCINLMTFSKIPVGVINMESTFASCTLINDAPQIPNTVKNMTGTFRKCSNLLSAPTIPNSVTNMQEAFRDCTNLVSAPTIPNSVTNMQEAFINCSKLTGIITINANLTGAVLSNGRKDYYSMFWNIGTEEGCEIRVTGTCPILQEYVTALNRDNITLLD